MHWQVRSGNHDVQKLLSTLVFIMRWYASMVTFWMGCVHSMMPTNGVRGEYGAWRAYLLRRRAETPAPCLP